MPTLVLRPAPERALRQELVEQASIVQRCRATHPRKLEHVRAELQEQLTRERVALRVQRRQVTHHIVDISAARDARQRDTHRSLTIGIRHSRAGHRRTLDRSDHRAIRTRATRPVPGIMR
jgi:hypothetical protein